LAKEGKFFSEEVYIVLNCTYLKTSGTVRWNFIQYTKNNTKKTTAVKTENKKIVKREIQTEMWLSESKLGKSF